MGLFAKRKNNDDEMEDLESTDEWLMGLTDTDNVSLEDLGDYGTPPPPAAAAGSGISREGSPYGDGGQLPTSSSPNSASAWHFPDLDDGPTTAMPPAPYVSPIIPGSVHELSSGAPIPDQFLSPTLREDDDTTGGATYGLGAPEPTAFEPTAFEADTYHAPASLMVPEALRPKRPQPISEPFDQPVDYDAPSAFLEERRTNDASVREHTSFDLSTDGPVGPEALPHLEMLGLGPDATWQEIKDSHRAILSEQRSVAGSTEMRELAEELRRESNAAYAALRLLAVS